MKPVYGFTVGRDGLRCVTGCVGSGLYAGLEEVTEAPALFGGFNPSRAAASRGTG